ncbi:hydroxymethylglutaryl-CoA synthase [Fructilactobacillus fructivorans]|uniref:Hydroxymethylglutaryl-CoA synthase n=1 Tax=Fructilactobacillus fructivorans TaxID=1614 RepID=A0A0C1Q035_9LACO|nr:hydroxymethylglutaryl-CoA synthase [Fructilactobacillus fructivorans]KID41238.1 Hydroxymethylglutaryl-CoA synthase [Fructilactobacillus fructivorans]MCT0152160.1 hydroxymethylglutaryl-CoA synthase [Fructilactobacillus fructivorans]MCT2867757.1 hydroxymethylglutaryl-CoA synthase [Fructilactobacillus fructivorans]MCT2868439.1 hydroxymethylglutaryl-CoA synthase [Fructilactobacillus fructivorans]MCT2873798.1 hydroxymethylglutaryl-CoA synthase [Fructilactobacillus fructivorans]
MKVGIDKIGFYTPGYYIDMVDLANARNEDPNKYLIGIGQTQQAVIPPTQDSVTLAANAAAQIIDQENKDKIDLIIFGSESGIDNSKSGAIYIQNLLGLSAHARAFEIKQACYGATAGLQMAKDYVHLHPGKQALVIGSDIARYGIKTAGEVTQGGGAVAMTIASNPDVMALSDDSSVYSQDIMDFWRPVGKTEALVDGHYSNDIYEKFFNETIHDYLKHHDLSFDDLKAIVFHLPYTKMGLKGLRQILPEVTVEKQKSLLDEFEASRIYSKRVGNLYTGSLYLSLLSLLDNSSDLKVGDQIGVFSYGSGAQGEFYTGILQDHFRNPKRKTLINKMLDSREKLSIKEYETVFNSLPSITANDYELSIDDDHAQFVFGGVKSNKRQYLKQEKTHSH